MKEWDGDPLLAGHDAITLDGDDLVVEQGVSQSEPAGVTLVDGRFQHTQAGTELGSQALEAVEWIAFENDVDAFFVGGQRDQSDFKGTDVGGEQDRAFFGQPAGVILGFPLSGLDAGAELFGCVPQALADVADEIVEGTDDGEAEIAALVGCRAGSENVAGVNVGVSADYSGE